MAVAECCTVGRRPRRADFVATMCRFAVNMTLQLNGEVIKVLELTGQGCNKSHIVHEGCWNVLTVARAQHVICCRYVSFFAFNVLIVFV